MCIVIAGANIVKHREVKHVDNHGTVAISFNAKLRP